MSSLDDLSNANTQVAQLFVGAILYGIYLVTLGQCLHTILLALGHKGWRYALESRFTLFFILGLLLFANGTVNISLQMRFVLDTIKTGFGATAASESYWSTQTNVGKMITLAIQVQLGDLILIYRYFVILGRRWLIIAFPSVLCVAQTFCAIMTILVEAHHGHPIMGSLNWETAFLGLTLGLNVITTVAIVHRLWDVMQLQRSVTIASSECCNRCHKVHDASRVVIESGSLYTAAVIATFIASILRCSVVHLFSAIVVHIVGISYNLIIANSLAPPSLCADPHHPLTHTPANLEFAHHPRERAESPIRFSVGPARFRVEDDPAAFMPPTRSKFRIAQLPPLVEEVETKGV